MRKQLAGSVIGTKRLILRPLRESDAAAIFALFNDWDVVRLLSSPPWPYTLVDAEGFVRAVLDGADDAAELAFAITMNGKLIGSVSVRERPASNLQADAGPNIGYWLGKPHWGQGYMTEAVRALAAHMFALSRADAIYSGAFADNLASLRVQEKLGFVRAGETTLLSRPTGHELVHVNTVLPRAAFVRLAA